MPRTRRITDVPEFYGEQCQPMESVQAAVLAEVWLTAPRLVGALTYLVRTEGRRDAFSDQLIDILYEIAIDLKSYQQQRKANVQP